jgi:hypothetical protein
VDTYGSHGVGSWKTFGGIKGAARSEVKLELRRQSYGVGEVARVAIYEYAVCVWGRCGGKQQGDDAAATAMLSGVSVEVDVRSRLPLFHCHPPRHEPQAVLCSPLANKYSRHRSCLLREPFTSLTCCLRYLSRDKACATANSQRAGCM